MGDFDQIKEAIDRVSDVIDDAINSNDYTDLSRQIGGLMRTATDAAGRAASSFAAGVTEAAKKSAADDEKKKKEAQLRREAAEKKARAKADRMAYEDKYFARPEDATGSKVLSVIGGIGTAVFGVLTITFGVFSSAVSGVIGGITAPLAVFSAVITACSFAMAYFGGRTARKTEHFKKYRTILLKRLYADVSDISKETGIPEKTVVKELKDFRKRGMIRQGRFDAKEKTFIASDEIYEQYLSAEKRSEELRQAQQAKADRDGAYAPEVRELLLKGNEYISMIHEANKEIPGEEVTKKLDRMETIVRRIFDEVRKNPSLAGSLNLFMNYYLPTTTKLINAYKEMDGQVPEGENVRTAKREIENSLDTINDAFEKLLDSFFKETAMDVSSDISVMTMMMQQEGLTDDDMTAMRRKQEAARKAQQAQHEAAQAAQAETAAQTQTAGAAQAAQAVQTAGAAQAAQAVQTAGAAQAAQAVQTAGEAQAQQMAE